MTLFLTNFLRRLGDFFSRNRASVIKWALILGAALVLFFIARYGVERIQQWSFERGVAAKDKEFAALKEEIRTAEGLIDALKVEMAAKDALLAELDKQYALAKAAHGKTRTEYVYLKDEYEKVRDNPVIPVDASRASACEELARLNYPCKPCQ